MRRAATILMLTATLVMAGCTYAMNDPTDIPDGSCPLSDEEEETANVHTHN